jgi:hypothetical protein
VVTHDGVGAQINGKYRAQQLDTVNDPLAVVFKAEARYRILATKEGAPNATGDAVVIRRVFDEDLAISWFWHGTSLTKEAFCR